MSESEHNERRSIVAMVGNPTSDKGRGTKVDAQVLNLLEEAGRSHNFEVIDITGTSFEDSLHQARERSHEYDYLVVVGGDGNMLGAARTLARYDIKVIGINRGNLGFLTDLDPDNAQQQLADVLEGHYISEKRFLLEAQVCQLDCQKRISTAINEVVLHPGKVAHMIEFEVYIDEIFAFSQRSDGLIISTPTGSTAYSLSAGGPILTPSLDAITLVPMFPHTLSARPLVINSSSTIRLRFSHRRNDLEISCDSQIALPIQEGEDVLIRRCDYHLNLIHPKDYSYFNTLSTKLGWSKKLF